MKKYFCLYLFFIAFFAHAQEEVYNPLNYFTQTEIDTCHTALHTTYLTQAEKNIFLYINLARYQPQKFLKQYHDYVIKTDGYLGNDYNLMHNEYYTSLSQTLKTMKPQVLVYPNTNMYALAKCWAMESGEAGLVGHDRIQCKAGYSAETCSYGHDNALDVVMQLLIDYNVESLGHRKILLGHYRGMGTSIQKHNVWRFTAVQNFSNTNDLLLAEAEQREAERIKAEEARQRRLEERLASFEVQMQKWSMAELKSADVGRQLDYLSDMEKDFYLYLNLMRLYPKKFNQLLWQNGPYYDKLPEDLDYIYTAEKYKYISQYLNGMNALAPVIPDKASVDFAKCVTQKYLAGNRNFRECGNRSFRLVSFYHDSNYNDFINYMLEENGFNQLLDTNTLFVMVKNEYDYIRVRVISAVR